MAEPNAGDVALACMRELADELSQGGVEMVCVSPGSRSTPLVLAFSRHGAFDVRTILDERSAAFFALGRARASHRPVALVCTSGTATANYLPAIVEASLSGVPLVVLTADRPPALRGTGANQTIDQHQIYGGYIRFFMETGVPRAHQHAAKTWRQLARRALDAAQDGPVHLNLPFDEPLTPSGAEVDIGEPDPKPTRNLTTPSPKIEPAIDFLSKEKGVILAGQIDHGANEIVELAEVLGWPLIAEPLSGLRLPDRALAAGQALLSDERFSADHVPDVVLQFGRTPTSRPSQRLAARAGALIVAGPRPADPDKRAAWTINTRETDAARALLKVVPHLGEESWLKEWTDADAVARAALDTFFDAEKQPFEPRVARDVAAALPDEGVLVVASSTPVRDLDYAMAPRALHVIANRGASGIDGFVSTALGVASRGLPTVALAGDLSLLHDASGLMWGARRGEPVTFVVVNNKGGGIFDLLPSARLPENDDLFVATQDVDLRALADAAGAAYETGTDLGPFLAQPRERTTIFEVPIDRSRAVKRRAALGKAVAKALSGAG